MTASDDTNKSIPREAFMPVYDLQTNYDTRASFYGKARVEHEDDGTICLISYTTRVAVIHTDGTARVYGTYSRTTLRHIKEFLLQHGFKAENSKQIMADYGSAK